MPEPTSSSASSKVDCIREVWQENLEEEFKIIRLIVQQYPYIAMDTEFPGIVCQPVGDFRNSCDYQYQSLRCNVDLLKIIQIGLTFLDDQGHSPSPVTTWQFNFKFNLGVDMFAQNSIDLLTKCGIQFDRHKTDGIDVNEFAELLMTSGIVLCDNVKWVSFHSAFDFAYLIKMLTSSALPTEETEFLELVRLFFSNIYDIKFIMKGCKSLKGGLQELAEQLEIQRIGPQHQAGSDSLLTGAAFFKIKELYFSEREMDEGFNGQLFGLTTTFDPLTVHPITSINSSTPTMTGAESYTSITSTPIQSNNSN